MTSVVVNDLVEELCEENRRLLKELLFANKVLKNFIQFKIFIDNISHKFKYELNTIELQDYIELNDIIESIKDLPNSDQVVSEETNEETNDPNMGLQFIELKSEDISQDISHGSTACEEDFIGVNNHSDNELIQSFTNNSINSQNASKNVAKNQRTDRRMNRTSGPFNCLQCLKSFATRKSLSRHKRYHSNLRLICQYTDCQKQFFNKEGLNQHYKSCHSEKKFICEYPDCEYRTSLKGNLELHKKKHSDERNYKCNQCSQAFKHLTDLNKHLKSFHNSGPLPQIKKKNPSAKVVKCQFPGCNYTATQMWCINAHKAKHSNERPFACDWPQCGQRFKMKKHLNRHMKIHINDRQYVCQWDGCEYRSNTSDNLNKHSKSHINIKF